MVAKHIVPTSVKPKTEGTSTLARNIKIVLIDQDDGRCAICAAKQRRNFDNPSSKDCKGCSLFNDNPLPLK